MEVITMPARGSGQFGEDVIVGSPEYWKLYRTKNAEKFKLAQKKYKAKQKELLLAAKLARAEGISVDDALVEIDARLNNVKTVERDLLQEGKLPVEDPFAVDAELLQPTKEIPFIREMADMWGIRYEDADTIMSQDESKWDSLVMVLKSRLK